MAEFEELCGVQGGEGGRGDVGAVGAVGEDLEEGEGVDVLGGGGEGEDVGGEEEGREDVGVWGGGCAVDEVCGCAGGGGGFGEGEEGLWGLLVSENLYEMGSESWGDVLLGRLGLLFVPFLRLELWR